MTLVLIEVFLFGFFRGTWAEVPRQNYAFLRVFILYVSRIGFTATAPFCYIVAMKFAPNECRFTFSHGERLEFLAFPSLLT